MWATLQRTVGGDRSVHVIPASEPGHDVTAIGSCACGPTRWELCGECRGAPDGCPCCSLRGLPGFLPAGFSADLVIHEYLSEGL